VIVVLADDEVERALVVVAHPDDAEFWAGGTIAGWTSAGIAVSYCVLSDGDSGGFDPRSLMWICGQVGGGHQWS
jgi:LmbE family N-acetylglucosaminyl deacetylase